MGEHPNVGYDKFPQQGKNLGKLVRIIFNHHSDKALNGICIRDDLESPMDTIFMLEDGRVINASECQWSPSQLSDYSVYTTHVQSYDHTGDMTPLLISSHSVLGTLQMVARYLNQIYHDRVFRFVNINIVRRGVKAFHEKPSADSSRSPSSGSPSDFQDGERFPG